MAGGNFRYSVRAFRKYPAQTVIALVAFGLGIGLTSTIYTIVYGTFLRGLPFDQSQQLVRLEETNSSRGIERMPVAAADFVAWRERQRSFQGLVGWYPLAVTVTTAGQPAELYKVAYATAEMFTVLRVRPVVGRNFLPTDAAPGAPRVALIGDLVWRELFNRAPDVVGRVLHVDGNPVTVIGVMGKGFRFPFSQDLWLPLPSNPGAARELSGLPLQVFGRLAGGASPKQAAAELGRIAAQISAERPQTNRGVGVLVTPYVESYVDKKLRAAHLVMLIVVSGVLLIACVNVANLLLARTVLRFQDLVVRSALGARRRDLAAQLVTESCLLAGGGGLLGLGLTKLGIDAYRRTLGNPLGPFWEDVRVDGHVFVFLVALSLLAGASAALIPVFAIARSGFQDRLRTELSTAVALKPGKLMRALVAAEVAICCCLLVPTGLMIESILNLHSAELGFRSDHLFTAEIALSSAYSPRPADAMRGALEVVRRLSAMPGVRSVGLSSDLPARWEPQLMTFALAPGQGSTTAGSCQRALVSDGYFAAMGLRLLSGRTFSPLDGRDTLPVAVVNQSFANRYFPGFALGRRLRFDSEKDWRTVVGVVADSLMGGIEDTHPPGVYLPLVQHPTPHLFFFVRTADEPPDLFATLKAVAATVFPTAPVYHPEAMGDVIADATRLYRLAGLLFAGFGIAALGLALIGLYGTMTFTVISQTRELGIRMALGARGSTVAALILRRAAWQLLSGLVVGLGLAAGLSRFLAAFLYKVPQWDPSAFGWVAAGLVATGLLACVGPAYRVTRIEAAVVSRWE